VLLAGHQSSTNGSGATVWLRPPPSSITATPKGTRLRTRNSMSSGSSAVAPCDGSALMPAKLARVENPQIVVEVGLAPVHASEDQNADIGDEFHGVTRDDPR